MKNNDFAVIFLVLLITLFTSAASADKKADAKKHFESGLALLETEDYKAAAAAFKVSAKIYPTKMGLYNLANCYKAMHKYGDAIKILTRIKHEFKGKLDTQWKKELASFEQTIRAMVGHLKISVTVNGATIMIDGENVEKSPAPSSSLSFFLAPGAHDVTVTKSGYLELKKTVHIISGGVQKEFFNLKKESAKVATVPAPAEPQNTKKPAPIEQVKQVEQEAPAPLEQPVEKRSSKKAWGWTSLITGVLVAGTSSIFYGMASGEKNNFNSTSSNYNDTIQSLKNDPTNQDLLTQESSLKKDLLSSKDKMQKNQNLGLTFAITGSVLMVTGIALLAAGKNNESPSDKTVNLSITPGGLLLHGSF